MHGSQSARTLTTYLLEVESEGINESDNYTGGCLGGLNEPGWAVLARTPGDSPSLGDKCPGMF